MGSIHYHYHKHGPPLILLPRSRLDESNLILRGTENEASSVILKGTLVLCLSEPLRIHGIRLRFTGERKLGSGLIASTTMALEGC